MPPRPWDPGAGAEDAGVQVSARPASALGSGGGASALLTHDSLDLPTTSHRGREEAAWAGCPHPQAELSSGSFLEESWVHETEAVLPFLPEPAGWSGLTAMRAPSSAALDSLLAAVTSDFAGIFH